MKYTAKIFSFVIIVFVAVLCLFEFPIKANAATEGIYTYTVSDGEATITDCSTSVQGAITIPSVIGGYPVTGIGEKAFYACKSLTDVIIPDCVTSIGQSAFHTCSSLITVNIPTGVADIEKRTFYQCSSLTSIIFHNNTISIGEEAFYGCSTLTNVVVPDSVTSIGEGAFGGCIQLKSITIPFVGDSRKTSKDAYQYPLGYIFGTTNYTGSAWARQQYYGASGMVIKVVDYYIPESLTSVTVTGGQILYGAFYNCKNLISVELGDCVTALGDCAFYGCTGLTSVTIGDGITSIGVRGFENCTSLANITIGDGVMAIENFAFCNCSSLTSVTFGSSVNVISGLAFKGCEKLIRFDVDTDNPNYSVDSAGALFNKDKTTLIRVPCGFSNYYNIPEGVASIRQYAFYECDDLIGVTIPNGVTEIGGSAFYNCSSLTSVTIPDGITSISGYAFAFCGNLTSFIIPDSVTIIEYYAFYYCSSLTGVTIPNGVTEIGSFAFCNSSSLENLIIPDSVTNVGMYAFADCAKLKSVTIPDGVTVIEEGLFSNCSNLTSVAIPNSVTSIGHKAFEYCSSLLSVEIPDGVTLVSSSAFESCSSLKSVTIPNSVTALGSSAFANCHSLTSVIISDNITYIGPRLFYCCENLKKVTVPDGVTRIWDSAFSYCSELEDLIISDSVTIIEDSAFAYCSSLTSVIVPDSVTNIGSGAFVGCSSLESITLPFIGDSKKTASDAYLYPLGYIFGTINFQGGSVVTQNYYGPTTSYTMTGQYYIPDSLKSVIVTGGDIFYGAFYNCNHLLSVTLPDSITGIGDYAFYNCSSLDHVAYTGTKTQWNNIPVGTENTALDNATIHCETAVVHVDNCAETSAYCQVCESFIFQTMKEGESLKHDWANPCESTRICTICGYSDENGGHSWDNPTSSLRYCSVCDKVEGGYLLDLSGIEGEAWLDGEKIVFVTNNSKSYLLLENPNAKTLVTYSYANMDQDDLHLQYPTEMKVFKLHVEGDYYKATYIEEFDNLLQYAGSSIRITGTKGIRMITGIDKTKKAALTGDGLAGYTLVEYGTALCWASNLQGNQPMVLGQDYVKSNYAYKKGVADPIFAQTKDAVQYTNVLVGFTLDQCSDDIAMRPYIVLKDAEGNQITIYGGIVYRSIGYIAYQNRNVFRAGTSSYKYVWEIIHKVYGTKYDADYKG